VLERLCAELPWLACDGSYRISLRKMRLGQLMMDAGCQVWHFSDCPPAAFAYLIDRTVLEDFEAAVQQVEAAAEGAGGRLVGPGQASWREALAGR
jgi:hypothetical protein